MSPSAAAPSPQEIQRKLSVHGTVRPPKAYATGGNAVSGTESDSDSIIQSPDLQTTTAHATQAGLTGGLLVGSLQKPLSSIAERKSGSGGEETDEDDEEDDEGSWKHTDVQRKERGSLDESVIKSGYLSKKGERRKSWKKRWFVLRPAHIAYYKTAAEYELLHLLDLGDVHSCTPVSLKKHANTFSLIMPARTFYLQASSQSEVQSWVQAIEDARHTLMATSTQSSLTSPIPIPNANEGSHGPHHITPSPPSHSFQQNVTSSDSEDGSPQVPYAVPNSQIFVASSPSKQISSPLKDPSKVVMSGYLMKCGSKRHNWRKRWFVLKGEKLFYSGSHMDTKPHREFSLSQILDALEYDLPSNRHNASLISPPVASPPHKSSSTPEDHASAHKAHTFKIITTKRTLLLCAPSEEEEIKWLGAVQALIARRSGAGGVPGDKGSSSKTSAAGSSATQSEGFQPSHSATASISGSGGLRTKVRTMSASGTAPTVHYDDH